MVGGGGRYIKFVVCGEGPEAEVLYFPKGGKMSPRRGREFPPNYQKQTDNNNNNNNNSTKTALHTTSCPCDRNHPILDVQCLNLAFPP